MLKEKATKISSNKVLYYFLCVLLTIYILGKWRSVDGPWGRRKHRVSTYWVFFNRRDTRVVNQIESIADRDCFWVWLWSIDNRLIWSTLVLKLTWCIEKQKIKKN